MSIGRPLTMDDINNTAANLAGQLFSVCDDLKKFQAIMDAYASADLVNMGFAQADADKLKSAIADLGAVADYFDGGVPGPQQDRRIFARQLLGTGVY